MSLELENNPGTVRVLLWLLASAHPHWGCTYRTLTQPGWGRTVPSCSARERSKETRESIRPDGIRIQLACSLSVTAVRPTPRSAGECRLAVRGRFHPTWGGGGSPVPNSCVCLPQAGGLMHAVLPTWTECTTHRGRTQISSTGLSGTTGKDRATRSRPQPWWSGRRTSRCLRAPEEWCPAVPLPPKALRDAAALSPLPPQAASTLSGTPGTRGLRWRAPETPSLWPRHWTKAQPPRNSWYWDLTESLPEDESSLRMRLTVYRLCCHSQECCVQVHQWITGKQNTYATE